MIDEVVQNSVCYSVIVIVRTFSILLSINTTLNTNNNNVIDLLYDDANPSFQRYDCGQITVSFKHACHVFFLILIAFSIKYDDCEIIYPGA